MKTELAIIGAGPAGLSAAIEAAKHGVDVVVIDENARPGGQLFKQIHRFFGSEKHRAGMRGFDIGNLLLDKAKKHDVNEVKVLMRTLEMLQKEDPNSGMLQALFIAATVDLLTADVAQPSDTRLNP